MKGIVLEIRDRHAAVLTDDGIVRKITNHDYQAGDVINMKPMNTSRTTLVRLCSCMAVVLALFFAGAYAWFTPVGYVSLDVNPSIEYSINVFDRVLSANAVNEDAKEVFEGMSFRNMQIEKAIEKATEKLIQKGYITSDEDSGIVIATFMKNEKQTAKAEKLAAKLQDKVKKFADKQDITTEVEAEAVGLTRVKEAKETWHVTPGKLNLVEKLVKANPSYNSLSNVEDVENYIGEWLGKSVKEINKEIKRLRKEAKEQEKAAGLDESDEDMNQDEDEDLNDDSSKVDKDNNGKGSKENNGNGNNGNSNGNNGNSSGNNSNKNNNENKANKQSQDKGQGNGD